jgi:hypothetical protein
MRDGDNDLSQQSIQLQNPALLFPLPSPPPCTSNAFLLLTKNKWDKSSATKITGYSFSLTNQMNFLIYNQLLPIKTNIQKLPLHLLATKTLIKMDEPRLLSNAILLWSAITPQAKFLEGGEA